VIHLPARAPRVALVVAALTLTLTAGCGSDDTSDREETETATAAADGVPDECKVFPFAMPDPDLGDVELMPADFPEPPVDATLCETGGTGGDQEYASYATSASEDEILDGYASALGASRSEDGAGSPIVTTTVEGVVVQVNLKDGGYSIVFARS